MHDKEEERILLDEEQRSWDKKWSEEEEMLKFWVFGSERREKLLREIDAMRAVKHRY